VKVKVIKKKVASSDKVIKLDILLGKGINKMGSLLDAILDSDVVQQRGSWYLCRDMNFAQGHMNVRVYLKENGSMAKKMEVEI
jgi:recombination protein RecA